MNSTLPVLARTQIALALLSAARPFTASVVADTPPDRAELARTIADHATELSRALAAMIHSGNATACSGRISAALGAQHDAIRRLHHLAERSGNS